MWPAGAVKDYPLLNRFMFLAFSWDTNVRNVDMTVGESFMRRRTQSGGNVMFAIKRGAKCQEYVSPEGISPRLLCTWMCELITTLVYQRISAQIYEEVL